MAGRYPTAYGPPSFFAGGGLSKLPANDMSGYPRLGKLPPSQVGGAAFETAVSEAEAVRRMKAAFRPGGLPHGVAANYNRAMGRYALAFNKGVTRAPKLGRFANPFLIGFALGWDLGVYIWGDPFAVPDLSVGAQGWTHPQYIYTECGGGRGSHLGFWYAAGSTVDCSVLPGHGHGGTTPCGNPAGDNPANYSQPTAADPLAHTSISAGEMPDPPQQGGFAQAYGTYWRHSTDPYNPADWVQQMTAGGPLYGPTPHWRNSEEPDTFPIGQPVRIHPQKWVDSHPKPGTEPSSAPRPRTAVNPRPSIMPLPNFVPGMPPLIGHPPFIQPPVGDPLPVVPPEFTFVSPPAPGMPPRVVQAPGKPPSNRPPKGPGKHEPPKTRSKSLAMGGTLVALNFATETFDFIDSIYKGLPKKYSNTRKTFCANHDYKCKMNKIWDHRDEIDFAEAFEHYVNNQAEDMLFGMLGGQVGKAQHGIGGLTGLNRATQHNQAGEAVLETGKEDQTGLLPTLTYDQVTGEWGFAWELFGLDSPDVFIPEVHVGE